MTQTKVRKFPEGDLILLFPEVAFNSELILSWQFIGEHGGASPALIHELPLATAKEKEQIINAYEKLYCCKVQDLERDRAPPNLIMPFSEQTLKPILPFTDT